MIDTQFSKMISNEIAEKMTYASNAISTISVLKKKNRRDQGNVF